MTLGRAIVKLALLGTLLGIPIALHASAVAAAGDTVFHPAVQRSSTQGIMLRRLLDAPAAPGEQVSQDSGRPRAVHYSDAYYTRLAIHRIGSYAIFPLFAGEYFLGNRLLNGTNVQPWVKPWHQVAAGGIAALFAVNTVTGIWNYVESRKEPEGRARKFVHMALMLAADAGFAYTGTMVGGRRRLSPSQFSSNEVQHRNAALVSMGFATAGTLVMWLWKD